MGINIESGNCVRPVANPSPKPRHIKNKNGRFKAPMSWGSPDLMKTSKNQKIAKINNGNRQILIFLAIFFKFESDIFEYIKAIQILTHNPISRKTSGYVRFKKVLPKKSIIGAMIIGNKFLTTLLRFRSYSITSRSTLRSNVK